MCLDLHTKLGSVIFFYNFEGELARQANDSQVKTIIADSTLIQNAVAGAEHAPCVQVITENKIVCLLGKDFHRNTTALNI